MASGPADRSASEGFGCDNIQEPRTRVAPEAVLLPDQPSGPDEFAWLAFDGRWGERHSGSNNGRPAREAALPLWTITVIVLIVQIALTPLGAVALTLLNGDAAAQREEDVEMTPALL